MVMDIAGVQTYEEKGKKPGICKTAALTRGYQFLLCQSLASDGIKFGVDLFTVTREHSPTSMMEMLREQLERLHWETAPASTPLGVDKSKLTGKVGSKNDDLSISVQMLLYFGRLIIASQARL
jgi:hypothetical protein